jgi:hypothetical protein
VELSYSDSSAAGKKKVKTECSRCGSNLRRLSRKGFLQRRVYTWFGYYPWECPVCRDLLLIKKQHQRKRHNVVEFSGN